MGLSTRRAEPGVGAEGHHPQLDGLRAFAVVGVLITHFLPDGNPVREFAHWGELGVQLFFVLSGFLITGILLRCRRFVREEGQSVRLTLRQFYARRCLRIFPLFYATIALCLIFDLGKMRETWGWHVAYLSNVGMVWTNSGFGHSTHFWTLAVEEQFYLLWPLLILALPSRWLPRALLAAIVVGPLFRLAMSVLPAPWLARTMLTPACLDTLAAGAFLAWLRADPGRLHWLARVRVVWPLFGIAFLAALRIPGLDPRMASAAYIVFGRLAYAGIFLFAIDAAARGIRGPLGRILSNFAARYIGKISYGIYVLHHFMIDVAMALGLGLSVGTAAEVGVRFGVLSAMSVVAAAMTWHFFERPLNALKRRFPYHVPGATPL